jgi:hypothetical protein
MHYIFDFRAQTQWMAINKSRGFRALSYHVAIYSIGLFLITLLDYDFLVPFYVSLIWIMFNGFMHGLTDYVTSRLLVKPSNSNWQKIFDITGLDQAIHYVTLFGSLYFMRMWFRQP